MCVVGGVGSINDCSGSAHRSLELVFPLCFGDGVCLRQKTTLLCFGRKSVSLSSIVAGAVPTQVAAAAAAKNCLSRHVPSW